MRRLPAALLLLVALLFTPAWLKAEPVQFDVPAQSADRALHAFRKQANVQILFSPESLRGVRSNAVSGRFEPEQALEILLRNTGFMARKTGEGKWVVVPTGPPTGTIRGKILAPDGSPARRVRVAVLPAGLTIETGPRGDFEFTRVPVGNQAVVVRSDAWRPLQINVNVVVDRVLILRPYALQAADDPTRLEPFVVEGESAHRRSLDHSEAHLGRRVAGGNLDLARTESDALPYMIFNRAQIQRSGVINLNEFLQRELIDNTPGSLGPEQDGTQDAFRVGSSNLGLRGYGFDETVILVNGRRLPEVLISGDEVARPPDVNFIPLSLVQQVEVLPVSASALYSGNAVGGVINVVLRPDVDTRTNEVTTTYTNALAGFDAPQLSVSLLHTDTLLKGALRIRLNASFSRAKPPTEAELGHRQRRSRAPANPDDPLFRATPNVHSLRPEPTNGTEEQPSPSSTTPAAPEPLPPLFGPGSPGHTSVAPGADGRGGLGAFAGRAGARSLEFFDSPGAYSTGSESRDFPYGRQQSRSTYYGSIVYDAFPWLQLAVDGTYSETVAHRGYEVMQGDLTLRATSPFNPFGRDVRVFLNEIAPALGENYNEARLTFGSVVLGALVKLPSEWRLVFDAQYAHNMVRYRALVGANKERWQKLVDDGIYNPLRDTRAFGPPPEFYDQVLVYAKGRNRFVTRGNYNTVDVAIRVANESLTLPTGKSTLNLGTDYRRNHLAKYSNEQRFADGSFSSLPTRYEARTLERYSFFGELQAPLVPSRRLPRWIKQADTDIAIRYVASNNSKEANVAPTVAGRVVFPNGLTLRGSVTTSTRFPTPNMGRIVAPSGDPGDTAPPNIEEVTDYARGGETYDAAVEELITPDLRPESAMTQTAGAIFQRGSTHRFRAAIDFVDTYKADELAFLDRNTVTLHEALWPERVVREPARPGDPLGMGRITQVYTGRANLSRRRSQNWTSSFDYRWNKCLGGTLEAYARVLHFQRYLVRTLPGVPTHDELGDPQGIARVLKYRANFGASWSSRSFAFGTDGHYFHYRLLPLQERTAQGRDRIRPFWQFDTFAQADLTPWLPGAGSRFGLRVQARIDNVFGTPFPKYVNDQYNAGIQPYGDWRGRVYSLSVTATF